MPTNPRFEPQPDDEGAQKSLPLPASEESVWPFEARGGDPAGDTLRAIAEEAAARRPPEDTPLQSGLRRLLRLPWRR